MRGSGVGREIGHRGDGLRIVLDEEEEEVKRRKVLKFQGERDGPGGGSRTHTTLRSLDFESSASASSATPGEPIGK